jgi:O-antigen/teichoic acid export membrane protein
MSPQSEQPLSGRRYLLSVIGFSSTARTITSALTLISFPIALRAVGAADYGLFVYVTALLTVVVCLADFGIAAAAGKSIAAARTKGGQIARAELRRDARLQALVALVALLPVVAISFAFMALARKAPLYPGFLLVMVLASWFGVASNFIRSCLRSFLAFGRLAVLDAVESTVRTVTWLSAAWLMPHALGLALANLLTAIVTGLVGIVILGRVAQASAHAYTGADVDPGHGAASAVAAPSQAVPGSSDRQFLRESFSFLGMGLSTRVFQSAPFLIFGALLDPEMVGVIGAFARLLEIISFPFLTIGNALAVRAHEVRTRGLRASAALWDACWRFVVVATIVSGAFLLTADLVARFLVPGSSSGPWAFSLLSFTILTYSIACFIPTMSDFVGGLHNRIVFLGALALCEIPVLWLAVKLFGNPGAVFGYLAVQVVMVSGYIVIARRVFFGPAHYALPRYIVESFGVVAGALAVAWSLKRYTFAEVLLPGGYAAVAALVVYLGLISVAFFGLQSLRRRFLTPSLFEFTHS